MERDIDWFIRLLDAHCDIEAKPQIGDLDATDYFRWPLLRVLETWTIERLKETHGRMDFSRCNVPNFSASRVAFSLIGKDEDRSEKRSIQQIRISSLCHFNQESVSASIALAPYLKYPGSEMALIDLLT